MTRVGSAELPACNLYSHTGLERSDSKDQRLNAAKNMLSAQAPDLGDQKKVAVFHGGGYTGRELIQLLLAHPQVRLSAVTSRTFAEKPLHTVHPVLRGVTSLVFTHSDAIDVSDLDAVL